MKTYHQLKIWPQFYHPVRDGRKLFEVRVNDRGFQPGDEVTLMEWGPNKELPAGGCFTDSPWLRADVGYVLPIDAERVVFSLLNVREVPTAPSERREGE